MITTVEPANPELAAVVGESRVASGQADCEAYAVDGRTPRCVVFPSSAEQVAAVLKCAAERGWAVIPCRNMTKLGNGNPPRKYDVALSLKEMNRVWHYEPADLTVSVEPGMKFGDFERFVGRRGLWLPLDPAGGARASIGGILATNSSGPLRLSYGAPRDMVLGIKVATSEGKIIKSGGKVVKNVAGYDLAKVVVGSHGTLGVIVEASLKLFPLPPERETVVFLTRGPGTARDLRRRISRSPLQPLRMVLLDGKASELARGEAPEGQPSGPELWVEVGGTPRVIERCARELEGFGREVGAPVRRLEHEPAELGWTRITDLRSWLPRECLAAIILKATVPISASEEFVGIARQELEKSHMNFASVGQTAVGVLHLYLWRTNALVSASDLVAKLRGLAERLGGALVVETCPPEVKEALDVWGLAGTDFEIMRKLKLAWDPKEVLSPGRFVGRL